ncbi:MAG: hypothetical protein C0591_14225 [Marinilabiliales bacterium]|nr:MAG: hypothetical protein C0591_14225 [Marinilabiliales bacterium]
MISYPNPFSNGVITEYELNQPEKTSLKIFNHMGKIAYQTQENLTQGKHQLIWDAEGIPDGIYYYRLQTGIEMAIGKLMKVE